MILLIPLALMFILTWFIIFNFHELCHIIEGFRHGATYGTITVTTYHGIPTMNCTSNYDYSEEADSDVAYAGGVYSGTIALLIGVYALLTPTMWDFPFELSFISVGIVNLVYGIYEGRYLHKLDRDIYMKWHYLIYSFTLTIMIIIYIPRIIEYVNML